MEKIAPNKLVIAILAAILVIVAGIVVLSGKEKTDVLKDIEATNEKTDAELAKIKLEYEELGKQEEFVELYNTIEQTVASKFLDGSITSEAELGNEINKINNMFKTNNWEYLNLTYPESWSGLWSLDTNGKLYFTFSNAKIKPDWLQEIDIKDYIK